ncbi:MAG: hypothetical protein K2W96_09110 [Gemmataceae bacterium]|nr:hypothetical protein [Gemmataceae bacterium]
MRSPVPYRPRPGRQSFEPVVLLALLVFLSIASARYYFRDGRPFGQQALSALLGAAQCLGVFLGLLVLLASVEMLKQSAARYRVRGVARRISWLEPWRRDGRSPASPPDADRLALLLGDADESIRRHALEAAFCLLRAQPGLATPKLRQSLADALAFEPGFAQALLAARGEPLLPWVTLGAKLGAGTSAKRLAPPTNDPAELARWAMANRDPDRVEEIQVSVGYDTGSLPGLEGRARFLGLWLFIASTELHRFQALQRRPRRDPNAAFGLVIRGDLVEVRHPGQARGHRLDYVFPLPSLDGPRLAALFARIQLLNLGLLAACADDTVRAYFPGEPGWGERPAAEAWRRFERRLVGLLRKYDRHRADARLHPLDPDDDEERHAALREYGLDEALYPHYRWVVPLYGYDTSWEKLLGPLRAAEAMMLHQGDGGEGRTVGAELVREARELGEAAAEEIALGAEGAPVPPDPFLDQDEEASRRYIRRVREAMERGEATLEELPAPGTFLKAEAYYGVKEDER